MQRSVFIAALVLAACLPAPTPSPGGTGVIELEVVAAPVCPVERDPPDPACAPRPVAGARILVQPGDGRDMLVGDATTDARGLATIEIAPGDYLVVGAEVEGLMGLPEPTRVTVSAGETVRVTLTYDTGIR